VGLADAWQPRLFVADTVKAVLAVGVSAMDVLTGPVFHV
jgi:hypothetical protein